jgi:hypothetical protein
MEPQGVPAGNLKGKFAGLLGRCGLLCYTQWLPHPPSPSRVELPFPFVADLFTFRQALISSLLDYFVPFFSLPTAIHSANPSHLQNGFPSRLCFR